MALTRSSEERLLFGVCGGLAAALRTGAVWLRAAFLVAALASGVGVVLYLFLAVFMLPPGYHAGAPAARARFNLRSYGEDVRAAALTFRQVAGRGWQAVSRSGDRTDWHVRLGVLAILAGMTWLLASLGLFWWIDLWRGLALCLIVIGAGLLAARVGGSGGSSSSSSS